MGVGSILSVILRPIEWLGRPISAPIEAAGRAVMRGRKMEPCLMGIHNDEEVLEDDGTGVVVRCPHCGTVRRGVW